MDQRFKISIKAARVNRNISQKKAAELLGINRATLRNYESGKSPLRWEILDKMTSLYQISIDNLFLPK